VGHPAAGLAEDAVLKEEVAGAAAALAVAVEPRGRGGRRGTVPA